MQQPAPDVIRGRDAEFINGLLERIEDFERLVEALQSFGDTLDAGTALHQVLEAALRLSDAHQGSLMLLDVTPGTPARTLIREGTPGGRVLDHYLNLLLAGWAKRSGRAVWTANLAGTFGANQIPARYESLSSALCVPIVKESDTIGVINLVSLDPNHPLGEREAFLVGALAVQCSKFLDQMRLHEALKEETSRLRRQVVERYAFEGIVGNSPAMQKLFALLEKVAATEGRVLIEGESGTGKEVIARAIHYNGARKNAPFVAIDCGALPANLLESELFGYVKGAFTGATQDKKGLFEEAHTGTLFLDEIGNMPLEIQAKLLRALQEQEVRPIGSTRPRTVDVRLLAASSQPLYQAVEAGAFRADLFYRLNVVHIALPPLRERRADIPLLARHFLYRLSEQYNTSIQGFQPETLATMEAYDWPGNVRELENAIERMVILAEPGCTLLPPELLPAHLTSSDLPVSAAASSGDWNTRLSHYEKQILVDALSRHGWNQSAAARELGLNESTLRYKMQKYGIQRP